MPPDDWLPAESGARLNLDAQGLTSVIWCTGYGLGFGFLAVPVLDEWNYTRHSRGVPEVPGLYAGALPGLTRHLSATLSLVGDDAEFVTAHTSRPRDATAIKLQPLRMHRCCQSLANPSRTGRE